MKKFVTTALLAAFAATSIFAFTACGENENEPENKEPVYTVTAEEWKTALNYLNIDLDEESIPVVSNYPRINFACDFQLKYEDEGNEYTQLIKTAFDYNKQAMFMTYTEDEETVSVYAWKENNSYYSMTNEDGGECNEAEFKFIFDANICEYAGGRIINEYDLVNKFSSFTYSEEKCEYTATFKNEGESTSCKITIKMKDGKLISLSTEDGSAFTYTYGNTVTVPDNIKNK